MDIVSVARECGFLSGIFKVEHAQKKGYFLLILGSRLKHSRSAFACKMCHTIDSGAVSRLSRQCVILNISQPYRPPRPVTGIALVYEDGVCFL
jgi:hypothetical protein